MNEQCASCRAPIVWAYTRNGKKIPVDVEPSPSGNIRLVEDGGAMRAEVLNAGQREMVRSGGGKLFTAHFVTCPQADEHRRAR